MSGVLELSIKSWRELDGGHSHRDTAVRRGAILAPIKNFHLFVKIMIGTIVHSRRVLDLVDPVEN